MSNLATIVNNILADSGIDDLNVVVTTGSYSNPAWITALSWSKITSTPTTLAGYGITNAYTKTEVDTLLNAKQNTLTLTTTGSSGASTLIGAILNIPTYTLSGLGGVPTSRTITINGVTQDLSADRTWTITAGVSSVTAGTGISVNQTTGAVVVTNTGVLSINGGTGAITGIATTAQLANYLPLSGGTMTGVINMVGTQKITQAGFAGIEYYNSGAQWQGYIGTESNTGNLRYNSYNGSHTWYANSSQTMALNSSGALFISELNVTGTETRKISLILPASYNGTGYGNLIERINFPWYSEYWDIGVRRGGGADIQSMEFWLNGTTKIFEITKTSGLAYLGGNTILTSANYNSYTPTLTGTGASGTWGISITGDANTVDGVDSSQIVYGSGPNKTNNINDFNAALASGFYDGYNATGSPSSLTYYHLISSRHTNTANNYQMQIAGSFFDANLFYYRAISNGTPSAWYQILHSGNYTSYAVPTSGYTFGTTFSLGTMYASTGVQGTNLDYMIGVYTNGYVYRFTSGAVASWIGLGSYLPLSGGTMSGTIYFANNIGTALQGTMGDNDYWRIYASGSSNAGYLEIATADDGTEPIYFSQYTGVFSSLVRRVTLLDGSGNTTFPGTVNVSGGVNVSGNSTWFSGLATLAFENQSTFARFAFYGLSLWDWDHGEQMVLNGNYVYVNNYLQAGNSLRAPIFYDSQDTNYYLDPAGYSQLKAIGFDGGYVQYGTSVGGPSANFGNGRIYLRVWPTSYGGRIMSFKLMISTTWNWAPGFGFITADVSFYFDGTNLYNGTTTITSATGDARVNLGVGQPVITGGYVSIPIYSVNTNNVYAKLEGAPSFDWSTVSWGAWESVGFPGAAVVNVPGSMTISGALTVSGTVNMTGRVNIGEGLGRPAALNSDSAAQARIGGSDVFLYVASLGPAGGYKVAMQSARSSDFASFGLDLQSNGGTLYYGGNEVATRTWASSQFVPISGGINMTGSFGLNDNKLYLRGNGDNNHYLWNAADDWEELNAYEGTGFRITSNMGSTGVLYVYGSSNGGYTYSPYSFRAPIFYDSADTTYYVDLNSGSYMRGLVTVTGGHYNSAINVILRADENGAATGQVTLRAWCSEPGVTWDWAGFGYNVTNDGASPYGFGRLNSNFGQAYMRFSSGGQLRFYNTNTSGTRVETAIFAETGAATFNYAVNLQQTLYVNSTATISYSGLSGDFGAGYTTGMGVGYSVSVSKGINMGWNTTYDMGFIGTVHNGTAWKSLTLCPIGGAVYIGITGNNYIYAGAFFEGSDKRLKQIVKDDYRAIGIESVKTRLYTKDGKLEVGYYAQDLEDILPSAVSKGDSGFLSLSYTQVHTAKIAYIEDSIEEIKAKILYLENQLKTKQ